MTTEKKDFYGKEVTDAIRSACETLGVPQEKLEIEVVTTGSTGIFGLIRKKAHIVASIKASAGDEEEKSVFASAIKAATPEKKQKRERKAKSEKAKKADSSETKKPKPEQPSQPVEMTKAVRDEEGEENLEPVENLPEEALAAIKKELETLLETLGYPSAVTVSAKGTQVTCNIDEQHEDILVGQDGKTLDALQYLLRKIVAKKVEQKVRLSVDVGNYREKRLEELKTLALDLAVKVKEDGKTQIIPALSPSERRVIHMSLQHDKDIRSRSVGDGLFKKILIYLPGKNAGKSSGKKRTSRGRRNSGNRRRTDKASS